MRRLDVVKDAAGPTTVRKCSTYMKSVFDDNADKQWQFEELLVQTEETNSCSGICNGIEDEAHPLFTFSNINDGAPQTSCREALKLTIAESIDYFNTVYLIAFILSTVMISTLALLLVCQIWCYCHSKCARRKLPL